MVTEDGFARPFAAMAVAPARCRIRSQSSGGSSRVMWAIHPFASGIVVSENRTKLATGSVQMHRYRRRSHPEQLPNLVRGSIVEIEEDKDCALTPGELPQSHDDAERLLVHLIARLRVDRRVSGFAQVFRRDPERHPPDPSGR